MHLAPEQGKTLRMTADRGVRRIGNRYLLQGQLGKGGMGVVWAATDELLGRRVAVKEVIPPTGLTAEQAEMVRSRSMREARAAARIASRSAVNVYDVVEEDGRPWIVMELLDAQSLSELINANGPLPPKQVADIAGQLLEALTAAHASGVLHRDVKPSNVMVAEDGRVVLTDFGIAALDGDPSLTTTGMLIGSPAYIAPERARGEPASAASDLWSLGCTIFVALEGRPPFDREGSMATLSAVLSEEPLPAPSAGPLAPVLEGLLRKDPQRRLSAQDTDRLLKLVATAPAQRSTTPLRQQTRPAHLPPTGGRAAVLRVQPQPQPQPRSRPPRRDSKALVAAVVVAVLVLAAIVTAAVLTSGDAPDQTASPSADADSSGAASDTGDAAATTEPEDSDPAPSSSSASAEPTEEDALPDGFLLYEDETGFSLAVPADWEVTKDGPRTDFTEPGTGRFLRVDQTQDPQPEALADWENQEATVSQRLSGYELIRIDPVEYRDYESADWEFTWEPDDGQPLHVLNRNLITGPDRAYALYWNTPADQWEESLPVFETFTDTFQPAP